MVRPATILARALICLLSSTLLLFATPAHAADITPPDTSIIMGPVAALTPGVVFFGFASTEAGPFVCVLDSGPWLPCGVEGTHVVTVTALGAHTFAVAAIDGAGNVDPTPATYGFTILPQTSPPAAVSAQAISGRRKLRVDVDPDWASGNYELTVQKLRSGKWKSVRRSSTQGSRDVRTLDLGAGRYRVVIGAANSLAGTTSEPVRLTR